MAEPVRADLVGGRALIHDLAVAPAEWHRLYHARLRTIAEPTRLEAEKLALTRIRRMWDSPQWARMRVVVGHVEAFVAPAQRGSHGGTRNRANLADLLEERALDPAELDNEKQVERDLDRLTQQLLARLERGS